MYRDVQKLEMASRTVQLCGAVDNPSITLDTGVTVLRNCTLKDNPVETIVVQGTFPTGILTTPVISLEGCTLERNRAGMAVFHDIGIMKQCRIVKCRHWLLHQIWLARSLFSKKHIQQQRRYRNTE